MYRAASFIWTPREARESRDSHRASAEEGRIEGGCQWFLFRRAFTLPCDPRQARLRIGVDGDYELLVNGARVARGRAPADPHLVCLDTHELAPHLKRGRNAIGLLIRVPLRTAHEQASQRALGHGGLYVDGEIACGEETIPLRSDARWRCLECYVRPEGPGAERSVETVELHDGTLMPEDWSEAAFDARAWARAREIGSEPEVQGAEVIGLKRDPFPTLLEREPQLHDLTLVPDRVLRVDGLEPWPDLSLEQRMLGEGLVRLPAGLVDQPNALLHGDGRTLVRTRPNLDVSFLIDFGCVHPGHPFVEFEARGGEVIELAVTVTRNRDALSQTARRADSASSTHARIFRYVARPGRQRFEAFERSTLRYLQLVVRHAREPIKILRVGSEATLHPVDPRGQFQCSDPDLNRLWGECRDALAACLPWADAPAREAGAWPVGALVQLLASQAAFGPSLNGLHRQLLEYAAEVQRSDGLLECSVPGRDAGLIPTPDGTLQWILAADLHHQYTADLDTIERIFPAVQRALAWFERHIGPNDLIADAPYWTFLDWADIGRSGEAAALNALFVGSLRAAERMALALENQRAAQRIARIGQNVSDALNYRHWDRKRGVYVDTVDPATARQGMRVSQHTNAALVLFEVAPNERWDSMLARVCDPARLVSTAATPLAASGDSVDPEEAVVRAYSPFMHFVLSALARAGRFDLALQVIRRRWLPQLDGEGASPGESLHPAAGLCHALSATPLYHLSTQVLGVAPLGGAFSHIRIAPQPGDLEWAEGIFPTVRGDVRVSWRQDEEGLDLNFKIPRETSATIVGPPGFDRVASSETPEEGTYEVRLLRDEPPEGDAPETRERSRPSWLRALEGLPRRLTGAATAESSEPLP
jgi:hypothetical protein